MALYSLIPNCICIFSSQRPSLYDLIFSVKSSVVDPELLVSYPDPAWTKNWKNTLEKVGFFSFKNCYLLIPRPPERTSKLQEKPLALKKEHRALQKMKLFI
jgi:hypothetical protein